MRALQVIILAAGEGSRMKSDLPKVLHPICGRPMIAYALDLAAATGVKQPVVVLGGETAEAITPHLPKEMKVVIQQRPLGTGDAVLTAKRALGGFAGSVLILYADSPLLRRTTIQRLIETHHRTQAIATLLTTHLADPTGYGRVLRDPLGAITGIVEEPEASAQQRTVREVNSGPLCAQATPLFEVLSSLRPSAVKKELYLTHALQTLAQRDGAKVQAARLEEATEAMGVNSRLDLARATSIIRQRIIEQHLYNGVTIVDPTATFIEQGVSIGQDTVIHPGCVIESKVAIGRRCSIGPFARLRSGVTVGDDTRVGNFVELVRTRLGNRVRMAHVSYLGDTTVEDEVNIGAGTITANYDGAEKHPTTIGKGAFIGCDTMLIAPVRVGPGAVTGAGSVIPKHQDVPPRAVVAGVPARLVEKGAGKAGGPARPVEKAAGTPSGPGQAVVVSKPGRPAPGARKGERQAPSAARAAKPTKRSAAARRVTRKRPAARKRVTTRRVAKPPAKKRRPAPTRARRSRPTRKAVRARGRRVAVRTRR